MSGPHLDFGICYYSNGNQINLPVKYFLGHLDGWNNGNDLDFIQPPRIYHDSAFGTTVEVIAYGFWNGPASSSDLTLTLYMRPSSDQSGTFQEYTMIRDSSTPHRFYLNLAHRGYNYQNVDFYIKVMKKGDDSTFITRPLQYESEAPTKFYSAYISPGSISPLGQLQE